MDIEALHIQRGLEESVEAARARGSAPGAAEESFDDLGALLAGFEALDATEAKRHLVIARRAGGFVKEFPAGPGIRPNGWRYFVPAIGCPADCRYCFLQTYHPAGAPIVFAEREALFGEIRDAAERLGGGYFYGGELCDDFLLEDVAGIARPLVELFGGLHGAKLELRTKGAGVSSLGEAPRSGNVIISWTFTPSVTAERLEKGTASLAERIGAARLAQEAGYVVGVRMDPIVLCEGWEAAYAEMVGQMASQLDSARIESAHLGCLRFTGGLKAAVNARFGGEESFAGEFAKSPDGKYRYLRPVRAAAYAAIAGMVRRWSRDIPVRLCMETEAVEADFRRFSEDFRENGG